MTFPDKTTDLQTGPQRPAGMAAVQGMALPARLNIEAQILNRPKRLPGLLVPNTSLTEDLETLAPSDYLGVDVEEDAHVDAFAQMK